MGISDFEIPGPSPCPPGKRPSRISLWRYLVAFPGVTGAFMLASSGVSRTEDRRRDGSRIEPTG